MNTFLPLNTQHLLNGGRLHLTVGKGNGLIRQRQGISYASSGRSAVASRPGLKLKLS